MTLMERFRRLLERPRAWRWVLIGAIVLPVLLVLPHARSLVVRNAVLTTYTYSLSAPITGQIVDIAVRAGTAAPSSRVAFRIRNDRVDRSRLASLEILAAQAQGQVERLRAHLQQVRSLEQARRLESKAYELAVSQDLKKEVRTLTDQAKARRSALKEAESNLERVRRIHEDGLLSASDLEAAEATYQAAVADYSANQLELERLGQRLDEAAQGVFQVDVPDGVLLTRQSADTLQLLVLSLERKLLEEEARWRATEAELVSVRQAHDRVTEAEGILPAGKTVWDVPATSGSWTVEGAPVVSFVDCSNLLVDIAVDDATLELIEPGHRVRIRLFGAFRLYDGEVILVRGSSALATREVLAAQVEHRGRRKGRVLARLDAKELAADPVRSCGIGRTAYAEFEGINLLEMILLPLFR